ncbi:MAG: carboxypeptidase-like regulatory domain-containing protein, partial [Alistipes sp.]
MVKKIVLSLIAVLGVCAMALSQNKQISGTVTGPDGNPIAGASVMVDGTSTGTTTGADGKFAFSAPTNGTLSVSFIGYEAQTIAIAGKTSFRVSLKEDT